MNVSIYLIESLLFIGGGEQFSFANWYGKCHISHTTETSYRLISSSYDILSMVYIDIIWKDPTQMSISF